MRHEVDDMFRLEDGVGMMNPTAMAARDSVQHYIANEVLARKASPRDDLFTVLAEADFPRPEIPGEFGMMLFAAGSETVARLLGWAASVLAEHPDQRAELVDDPTLVPRAVEELLRYEAPSPVQARWLTKPVEAHGTTMPVDSKVVLLTGAADRDERKFPDPDRFDIHRNSTTTWRWASASTSVWAPPWRAWRVASASRRLWPASPAGRWTATTPTCSTPAPSGGTTSYRWCFDPRAASAPVGRVMVARQADAAGEPAWPDG